MGSEHIFYGRRYGRALSPAIQALLAKEAKPFMIAPDWVQAQTQKITMQSLFANSNLKQFALEIGIGSGEHLIALAKQNPYIGYIGCEAYMNGIGRAARDIIHEKLDNIQLYPDDARDLLDRLPAKSLNQLFILFPDPWPKRRHCSRRMINPDNLVIFHHLLKEKGELRFASDHPQYIAWGLSHLLACEKFNWQVNQPRDWLQRPEDWPSSRYEQKRLAGQPHYFEFVNNE